MFGKHCSKRIESGVNRLHSSSLVAVRDLSTNPLLGVHDLQDVLRGHNLIHSVVHNSCLRLDSCRMSCLNQLLGWQWCLHNKRTGERDGCFSRSSFIQRLAKEAERRRTGGAEILFILFRAEKESCSPFLFYSLLFFYSRQRHLMESTMEKAWMKVVWRKTCGEQNNATSDETAVCFVDSVMVSKDWTSLWMTHLNILFLAGREVFSTDNHCRISSGWQGFCSCS